MTRHWHAGLIGDAFVNAAIDPTRWNEAMEVVAKQTESPGALLVPYRGQLPDVPHSESLIGALDAYVRDGWIHRDDRYAAVPKMIRSGVITDLDFTTVDDIGRRAFYQEFLAPFGLRWFAGVKVAAGDDVFILSIQRTIAQGPFPPGKLRFFAQLSTRLAGAAAMARALGLARADIALEVFQASGTAAVLTDRSGDVFRANAAAESLLGADFQIQNRKIVVPDREAGQALHKALHSLLWRRSDVPLSEPIVLPRVQGRPIVAYPLRLPSLACEILAPARAVVLLIDLERRPTTPDTIIRSVFGLTEAESALALCLGAGDSLEHAAERLGIAYQTARNQLKAVFAKTETSRQGELVALTNRLLRPRSI